MMRNKYSFIELFLCEYRWARKLSGGFWVRMNEPGICWIKFNKSIFNNLKFSPDVTFEIEDYT